MVKLNLILLGTLFTTFISFAQNVGINSNGAAPNASSMLDITSTSKGLLIPRVTSAQKTAMNPLPAAAEGLTVYQTNGEEGFYYNISTTTTPNWVRLMPADEGWKLAGNASTTAGTDFLGTTDAVDLVIKSNNTERIRIESDGDIGIGTATPAAKTHIYNSEADAGVVRIDNPHASGFAGAYFYEGASLHGWIGHVNSTSGFGGTSLFQVASAGMDMVFSTNSGDFYEEQVRIDTDGNVGINMSAPEELLHIQSDDADIDLETNGTDVSSFHFKKSRGTSASPTTVLDGTNLGKVEFQGYDGSGFEIAASITAYVDGTPSNGSDMPGSLSFNTSPDGTSSAVARMNIAEDGETWIDSETNGSTGYPLTLYRSTASPADGDRLEFGLYHEGSAGNYAQIAGLNAKMDDVSDGTEDSELRIGTIDGGTYYHELVIDDVGNVFPYYDNNGSLGTSADRWTQVYAVNGTINTSDMRYKKNVQPLTYGLNEIMQLSTFTYQWDHDKLLPQSEEGDLKPQNNLDNNYHIGFSAQEMQTIIPELVVVGDDAQNNLGVYYSHLAPVLTKAIQEQQEMIDEQHGMIEDLQNIIKELQKEIESLK